MYYLNSEGRSYVDSKKVLRKNQFVNHTLMRNEWFIFKGNPSYWRNEIKVGDSKESIVCDAIYKENGLMRVLEVDMTQKMAVNREKIKTYKSISLRVKDFPLVIFFTHSEHRRKQLIKACSDAGLKAEVYTLEEIS